MAAPLSKDEQKKIVERINIYADNVLQDIDPQKTKISLQIQRLEPVMKDIAKEYQMNLEDVFILYMDLNSEFAATAEQTFQDTMDINL